MGVRKIQSAQEFTELINGGKTVLVDFWADWCGPCKMISPVFEKLSDESASDDVVFASVDVDAQEEIAATQGIRAMPTFKAYRKGQVVGDLVGAAPPKLTALVKQVTSA